MARATKISHVDKNMQPGSKSILSGLKLGQGQVMVDIARTAVNLDQEVVNEIYRRSYERYKQFDDLLADLLRDAAASPSLRRKLNIGHLMMGAVATQQNMQALAGHSTVRKRLQLPVGDAIDELRRLSEADADAEQVACELERRIKELESRLSGEPDGRQMAMDVEAEAVGGEDGEEPEGEQEPESPGEGSGLAAPRMMSILAACGSGG
jgi:hypothetical protein